MYSELKVNKKARTVTIKLSDAGAVLLLETAVVTFTRYEKSHAEDEFATKLFCAYKEDVQKLLTELKTAFPDL